jgi:serine protease Do
MIKKFLFLIVLVTVPLLVGYWTGYHAGAQVPQLSEDNFLPTEREDKFQHTSYTPHNRDSITDDIFNSRHNAITRAVTMASPAVVGINVTEIREYRYLDPFSQFFGNDPFFRQFFGDRVYRQPIKSLGSGFIISPDGYVLTNDHVAGNGTEITVTMTNGDRYPARLIGSDPVSDICLLKIDGNNLPYLRLGNSDDIIIGEWVIALGNPFGLFEVADKPTVTVGVVSAAGLDLRVENRSYRDMIQTDAAINSGNSGGPLINATGEVIGMNSVIYSPNQGNVGVGFAIPANRVKKIIAELKKSGKVERNFWTGLEIQNIDDRVARYFRLKKAEGVIVTDVKRNSPAERAGFHIGDIIIMINGERITNEEKVLAITNDARVGDVLKVTILRENEEMTLNLRLEKRSQ